jgi:hypothetical protein
VIWRLGDWEDDPNEKDFECKSRIYYYFLEIVPSLRRVREVFHFLVFFGTQIVEIEIIVKNCFTRLSS